MQTTSILYIILALLLSLSVAFFQYYYKAKSTSNITKLLFGLKAISIFLLLLLLVNPIIKKTELKNTKPTLAILVDNSASMSFLKESKNIELSVDKIKNNKQLVEKFNLKEFAFGNTLQSLDSFSFDENATNIYKAINDINILEKGSIAPIILLTDGNQTFGNDYAFIKSKQPIYPIVFGDTTAYQDLKISQLNVNRYSYLKNKFPIETLLNYDGKETVNTQFSIFKNGKTLFKKNIRFSPNQKSKTITTNLESTQEGLQYYTASIKKLLNEKNIKNNSKNFSVEVINEQTKVLLLTSVLHPDIGALKKAITANKQRSVDIFLISKFKDQIKDYQLVIVYQPNNQFNYFFQQLKKQKSNFFIITGENTDWNFINKQSLGFTKNFINQSENYSPIYNKSFLTFLQKDIGFNQFPPLKDVFGEIIMSKEHQKLLFQNINGVPTQQPLLATFEQNDQKWSVLFGQEIWKWRSASFLNSNSFEDFDEFLGNLIQYVASNKKRDRLEVLAESMYPVNSTIPISAFYTDKNFQFDPRASLDIAITNRLTKKTTKLPFSLVNKSYQIEIENLVSGDYTYKVTVIGQNISRNGRFKITETTTEELFTNANHQKLESLATKARGKLYYKDEVDTLIKELVENTLFYTTQKSTIKEQNLIDWKWVLFLVIALFTSEWFIRKYYGKI